MERRDDEAARIGAGAEQGQHLVPKPRVEVIGRLVQQTDCGVLCDERGDVEPAPFASGQRIDGSLG